MIASLGGGPTSQRALGARYKRFRLRKPLVGVQVTKGNRAPFVVRLFANKVIYGIQGAPVRNMPKVEKLSAVARDHIVSPNAPALMTQAKGSFEHGK